MSEARPSEHLVGVTRLLDEVEIDLAEIAAKIEGAWEVEDSDLAALKLCATRAATRQSIGKLSDVYRLIGRMVTEAFSGENSDERGPEAEIEAEKEPEIEPEGTAEAE